SLTRYKHPTPAHQRPSCSASRSPCPSSHRNHLLLSPDPDRTSYPSLFSSPRPPTARDSFFLSPQPQPPPIRPLSRATPRLAALGSATTYFLPRLCFSTISLHSITLHPPHPPCLASTVSISTVRALAAQLPLLVAPPTQKSVPWRAATVAARFRPSQMPALHG
ncbi:hypothetical protein IWZ00DRAFT_233149, partial [Phyllosticta capitalensis]